jgi:hypothetical protein
MKIFHSRHAVFGFRTTHPVFHKEYNGKIKQSHNGCRRPVRTAQYTMLTMLDMIIYLSPGSPSKAHEYTLLPQPPYFISSDIAWGKFDLLLCRSSFAKVMLIVHGIIGPVVMSYPLIGI